MTMLQTIDPVGGEQRKRRKLKRRVYRSKVSGVSFVYYVCNNYYAGTKLSLAL